MSVLKTPGVYVVKKNAFPNSVVEIATAVPAFVGYTEKAANKDKALTNVPWRIASLAEFLSYFGGPPFARFNVTAISPLASSEVTLAADKAFSTGGKDWEVRRVQDQPLSKRFLLYRSMLLFFQNGGAACYVVSVGSYDGVIEEKQLADGIDLLLTQQEPTMVVIPDAVHLADIQAFKNIQRAALLHCAKMQSRVAILDVYEGYKDRKDPSGDCVAVFRAEIGADHLGYAAAYYPWLHTTVTADKDVGFENVDETDLANVLNAEGEIKLKDLVTAFANALKIKDDIKLEDLILAVRNHPDGQHRDLLNKSLLAGSKVFPRILTEMRRQLNILPPAAAMAGIYTAVDNAKGVWNAPANVSLNAVTSPTVDLSNSDQEDLNVDVQGKSVNAICSFIGEGVLVWGAHTLDGNSLDWRYISVRRTMIMLEQSIKLAAKAYVYEPNVTATWMTIKSMIINFLTGVWKRGGLAGATPDEAFVVHCGLGDTMTAEDAMQGILRVTVLVAVARPAEFMEITFQQQMQAS